MDANTIKDLTLMLMYLTSFTSQTRDVNGAFQATGGI